MTLRSTLLLSLVLVLSAALVVPTPAQIGTGRGGCNIVWTQYHSPLGVEGGAVDISIYGGWKAARFAAPLPPCVGVVVTAVEPLNGYSMSGTLEDGIEISFGGCLPDGFQHILRISYDPAPAQTLCCPYPILPHPAYGQIELIDCNDDVVVPTWTTTLHFTPEGYDGDCGIHFAFPAGNPVPADGETGVSPSVDLQWTQYGFVGCEIFAWHWFDVYFGTDPDPPLVAERLPLLGYPWNYNVGPLEDATTYYWRVGGVRDGSPIESPVWSFTTVDPLAVTTTTWGAIKALYRE